MESDQEDASGRDGELPSETLGCKLYGLCGCAMSSYIKFYKYMILFSLNLLCLLVMDDPSSGDFDVH